MEKELLNGFLVFGNLLPGEYNNTNNLSGDEMDQMDLDVIDNDLEKTEPDSNIDVEQKEQQIKKDTVLDDENDGIVDSGDAITNFFDVINDGLGIDLGTDVEKPKTPEELVSYVLTVIQAKSKPVYANDELEKLDSFVRNGGDIKNYLKIESDLDYDNVVLEDDENVLKAVLKDFLKSKGVDDNTIQKKISKYMDAGLLEEEAEDALGFLKQEKHIKKQELLKRQETEAAELEERNKQYFNNVVTELKEMNNIRGVKISDIDKQTLLDYAFKVENDGTTKFAKDLSNNVKNFLETAFFTMKRDTFVNAVEKNGQNSAIERFKNSLNNSGIRRTSNSSNINTNSSIFDSFVLKLRAN